jgi:GAF domain-containing protein
MRLIGGATGRLVELPRAGAARTPVAVGEHGQKRGSIQGLEATKNLYPMSLGRESAAARAILSGAVEQIPDVHADPEYAIARGASVIGFRSVAAVPMLKEGRPMGAITILRSQAGLLPETQITLLRTFADQAVIAIENARASLRRCRRARAS